MGSNNSLAKKYGALIIERDLVCMCAYCYRILDPVIRYEPLVRGTGIWYRPIQHTDQVTIDHVVPRTLGGPDHIDNYVLCCKTCNSRKGNKLPGEF